MVVLSSQSIGPFCGADCRTSCSPSIVPLTVKSRRICSSRSMLATISRKRRIEMVVDHQDMRYSLDWMKV